MSPTEIAIVSIFGRGHWLAVELAKVGIPVALVDVTPDQGPWSEVDQLGPFGSFKAEILLEQNVKLQSQGVCLWLNDGPVELQSVNVDYRLGRLGLSTLAKRYVQDEKISSKEVQRLSFQQNWLAQLSHVWNATISSNSSEALEVGKKVNLFDDFSRFEASSSSALERSLAWCEKNQVRVLRAKHIKDVALDKKSVLAGLEVQTDKPSVLKAEQFIWCLSQAETRKLSEKVRGILFPQGVLYPEWAWVRYRVSVSESDQLKHWLPDHCLILNDLHLPWSHDNFVICQWAQASEYDCWLKIPHAQRFQKAYLQDIAQKLEVLLEHKISGAKIQVIEWPLEAKMDEQRLGPNPFVVYKKTEHGKKNRDWSNIHFTGPEHWVNSSTRGQIENEKELFLQMKNWWDKKMEALAKRLKERNS